jgi:hypothetical protein
MSNKTTKKWNVDSNGGTVSVWLPFSKIDRIDRMRGDLLTRSKFISFAVDLALNSNNMKMTLLSELTGSEMAPTTVAVQSSDSPRAAPEEATAT